MSDLRALPSVDSLLREVEALRGVALPVARWLCRREVERARARLRAGGDLGDVQAALARAVADLLDRRLQRVINATGVVLHTNLGRAQISDVAVDAVAAAARATPVEFDLRTGRRAQRAPVASTLAAALCDADDALVVNNNAGALFLVLAALARGREVIVSRGELIEIGGEFRLPELMEASGAVLREVGTTNRTHARDYAAAIGERTAMVLAVHPSNYEVVGFTTRPTVSELAEIARTAGVSLVHDIGSGLLAPGDGVLADEPDALTSLAAGADLVTFSGDKLLGGPQAGLIAGDAELVERCRRHPVARAVRADKLTLAALEATLAAHARGEQPPVPAMINLPFEQVHARATALARGLPGASVIEGESVVGGGSVPGRSMRTALVAVTAADADTALRLLRRNTPPVIARVQDGVVVVDLRTVDPGDDSIIRHALMDAAL